MERFIAPLRRSHLISRCQEIPTLEKDPLVTLKTLKGKRTAVVVGDSFMMNKFGFLDTVRSN